MPIVIESIDLVKLQSEIAAWKKKNFPDSPAEHQLMGMGEEMGELFHAALKKAQGIRGTPEQHDADAKDAIGDLFVYAASFCDMNGWSLNDIIHSTWETVRRRDWQKNRQDGDASTVCPVCNYVIPPDRLVRVQGVSVHLSCAGTYARTNKS